MPALMLKRGEIYLPSEDGPVPARREDGSHYDPFDVLDRLAARYALTYLVDLDGVERAEPQLEFLQELSRDATLWIDGGVRSAEQAIDILVAGAERAVLSSAILQGARELRRAWRLSTEYVFELELGADGLEAAAEWETRSLADMVTAVRAQGIDHLVVSPRGVDPDWNAIGSVAAGGPTWVDGSFTPDELPKLRGCGARGGIFHIDRLLREWDVSPASPLKSEVTVARDDDS
jgi:hypothetical protein